MKIILKDQHNEMLEKNLRNHICSLSNAVIFDITNDRISHQILSISDKNIYTLLYSRPIFFNIFRPPLTEYEFVFFLVKDPIRDEIAIQGNIRLKNYVFGVLIMFVLNVLYRSYMVFYSSAPFNLLSSVLLPLTILAIYLVVEYLFFRKKIKKFINDLI